jgi:hypothetical protein
VVREGGSARLVCRSGSVGEVVLGEYACVKESEDGAVGLDESFKAE